jgi:hypothetical protein
MKRLVRGRNRPAQDLGEQHRIDRPVIGPQRLDRNRARDVAGDVTTESIRYR